MYRHWWTKCPTQEAYPGLPDPPQGHGIHVYLFWTEEGEKYLSHTSGEITAEGLCILAAEAVGETDKCTHTDLNQNICVKMYFILLVAHVCKLIVYSLGISPLCHVLFALYNPLSHCWYSPNHIFSPEDNSGLVVQYCMRLVCVFLTLGIIQGQ